MINVSIHDIEIADTHIAEGSSWVTLRLGDGGRVTIHTVNFGQAVAIADAINSERQARPPFDPLPLQRFSEAKA